MSIYTTSLLVAHKTKDTAHLISHLPYIQFHFRSVHSTKLHYIYMTMLAKDFMVPRESVVTCTEWDCIEKILSDLIDNKVSAVVVMDQHDSNKAVGLVTKTDLVLAYRQGISSQQKVGLIMATNIRTVSPNANRDSVAKMLEHHQFHHALVVDEETGEFMGMVSAWDIVVECARDARAWPFNRTVDGKIHSPQPLGLGAH